MRDLVNDVRDYEQRNQSLLHLTANENYMSETARGFLSSSLGDRYYFGGGEDGVLQLGSFVLTGMDPVQKLVQEAERACRSMLHAELVNFSCLSGVHAMTAVILACTQPGEVVMSVDELDGGHAATPGIISAAGRGHLFAAYDHAAGRLDVAATAKRFKEAGAKTIYLDISDHITPVDIAGLRQALGDKALIIYDASHSLGLIMGRQYPNPLEQGADIIVANTHKTFPGPQKAIIAYRQAARWRAADGDINSMLVSSAHTHQLLALAVSMLEMEAFGREYAHDVVANARALGAAFRNLGYEVVSRLDDATDNHQIHVMLPSRSDPDREYAKLAAAGISLNLKNTMHDGWYMRIGSQGVTRLGMNPEDMTRIVELIDRALKGGDVHDEVEALMNAHNHIHYSFDKEIAHVG